MPYAPGLDGLRAIAVIAVVLYHGQDASGLPQWLEPRGGFLGVEVFFVISGYLITALLLDEWERSGSVDLGSFWVRRARRLLPALASFLAGTTVLAALFATDALGKIRDELVGAVLYVSNWVLIAGDESYFEAAGRPSLLRHLWSLAIEGQFYLVWPIVVVLLLRRFGVRSLLGAALGGAIAASALLWLLFDSIERFGDVSEVYYRTDARAGALLIGAALACVWRPWAVSEGADRLRALRPTLDVLGALAVAGVIAVQYVFTDRVIDWHLYEQLYHGGFAVVSVLTAFVIAAVTAPGSLLGKVLGVPVLRWIGLRSYGLYLWHWPVFQLTRPRVDVDLDGWRLFVARWLITIVLTEISYRLIEVPARQGRFLEFVRTGVETPRRVLVTTSAALAVVAATAGVAVAMPTIDHGEAEFVETAATGEPAGTLAEPGPASPVPDEPPPPMAPPSATSVPTPSPTLTPNATPEAGTPDVPDPALEVPVLIEIPPTPTVEPTPTQPPLGAPAPIGQSVDLATARIYVFGDSVVLGAQAQLAGISPNTIVDGRIGRQWWEAAAELEAAKAAGLTSDVVVVQLGNNGSLNAGMFQGVMQALSTARVVLFLNVRAPVAWEGEVNGVLARYVGQVPDRARLIDWYTASNEHPDYFIDDATHLSGRGQVAFRQVIEAALRSLS